MFVQAYTNGDQCTGLLYTEATVCQCKAKWESCVEDGKVLGCCDEGFSCIKHKEAKFERAKCRQNKALDKLKNQALEPIC